MSPSFLICYNCMMCADEFFGGQLQVRSTCSLCPAQRTHCAQRKRMHCVFQCCTRSCIQRECISLYLSAMCAVRCRPQIGSGCLLPFNNGLAMHTQVLPHHQPADRRSAGSAWRHGHGSHPWQRRTHHHGQDVHEVVTSLVMSSLPLLGTI